MQKDIKFDFFHKPIVQNFGKQVDIVWVAGFIALCLSGVFVVGNKVNKPTHIEKSVKITEPLSDSDIEFIYKILKK